MLVTHYYITIVWLVYSEVRKPKHHYLCPYCSEENTDDKKQIDII